MNRSEETSLTPAAAESVGTLDLNTATARRSAFSASGWEKTGTAA
jgi:hypothetical protein